jgi:hypothetical protein
MKMKPVLGEVCGEVDGILVAANEWSTLIATWDCGLDGTLCEFLAPGSGMSFPWAGTVTGNEIRCIKGMTGGEHKTSTH